MRLFDTETYEEIIKEVQTSEFAVSMEGDIDDLRDIIGKFVFSTKADRHSDYLFIMDEDMRMKITEELIDFGFGSNYLGHEIMIDPDMPAKTVLFTHPDCVTLSGKIIGIERMGVLEFEQETETDTDE